ncbi:MAG: pilin [Patescibacteria group bacterium]|jgi:hypothetical protein
MKKNFQQNTFKKNFLSLIFIFLLAGSFLTITPAFGACECGAGGTFGSHWTAPESCFSDSDCAVPCERAYAGTTTPVDMTYACTTTGGTIAPEGSSPTTTPGAPEKVELENPLGGGTGITSVPRLIGNIIKTILTIVGALALAMFIYGGFTWMTSGGSSEKIQKGKNILMWAVIGLVVIFTSYTLVDFLLTAFGL